ncbi:MAG: hydroxyacylglutathione hydrolase [Rubrivivax sp.]
MNLTALPAFSDNYIWMLHQGGQAVVVDPGDAAPVLAALRAQGLQLAGILVTHHHPDHTAGIAALRPVLQGQVFGPAREAIPAPFTPLHAGQQVQVLGHPFTVMDVPGHTAGHIAYVQADNAQAPLLFCGDTLFSAGCGRLFEGTPAQMHDSLQSLATLPDGTQVCCTHEYTLSNLRFAAAVEPENTDVAQHLLHCQALRAEGRPTLPSELRRERLINPFLRGHLPNVVAAAQAHGATDHGPVAVLAALRTWKNQFQ